MNAKKCDRCGRYYIENNKHTVGNDPIRYVEGVQIYDDWERICQEWDLCDDCLTEFFNWVNKENSNEEGEKTVMLSFYEGCMKVLEAYKKANGIGLGDDEICIGIFKNHVVCLSVDFDGSLKILSTSLKNVFRFDEEMNEW